MRQNVEETADEFRNARLERLPSVLERTGLGRSTLYTKISRDEFPAPVHLGVRASAWVSREVDEWIASRAAQRDVVRHGNR